MHTVTTEDVAVPVLLPHRINSRCKNHFFDADQLDLVSIMTLLTMPCVECKNARSGSWLPGVRISVEGTGNAVTSAMGIFTLGGVQAGTVTLIYENAGYIKTTSTLNVNGNVRSGGVADISMSPTMASDEWRAVVKWGRTPSDLDTYGRWGTSTVWYAGRRKQNSGMTGRLEVDQTRGYGPETLHLSGVGSCRGSSSKCDVKYQINDYTRTSSMLSKGDAEVTLYNGDHVAGHWKITDCPHTVRNSGNWWDVFTIDGKTNQLKWTCLSAPGALIQTNQTSNGTSHLQKPHDTESLFRYNADDLHKRSALAVQPRLRIRTIT